MSVMSANPTLPLGIRRHMLGVIEILRYSYEHCLFCTKYSLVSPLWMLLTVKHVVTDELSTSVVSLFSDHLGSVLLLIILSIVTIVAWWCWLVSEARGNLRLTQCEMFQSSFLSMLKDFWQSFAIKTGIEMKEDIEGNVYCFSKNSAKTFVWMKERKKFKFHWLKA